jgi:glycosyltransferase involved in cell wall biosynthesis
LPIILASDPTIQFVITGRNPPNGLKKLCEDKHVTIVANPRNIRSVAERSSIAIVPLRIGGGTRLKILDAMSLGLPVISTSLGCEGLAVVDQENILIRDDISSFAFAVISLLNDQNTYHRIRENARRLVETSYTWANVYSKLESKIIEYL